MAELFPGPDPREVARKLSPSMRRAMLEFADYETWRIMHMPYASLGAARRRELATRGSQGSREGCWLTELGAAVLPILYEWQAQG